MGEFYMGAELVAQELPINAPAPAATPPEGVILVRSERDGWTRKYLYHVKQLGGQVKKDQLLIAEIPPAKDGSVPVRTAPQQPAGAVALPFAPAPPMRAERGLRTVPSTAPFMGNRLGQAPPAPSGTPTCKACPGPMQLPDGKVIQLDDPITLGELCQMLPYLLECAPPGQAPQAPAGPGTVPVVGGPGQPIPGAGFPSFGPASGGFGGGGFGGGGFGTPAGFGPVGVVAGNPQPQPGGGGAAGAPGPVGPAGPPGPGTAIDFISKTDGDFTAGPGAFVPVPETLLSFTQGAAGNVLFSINACFGCSQAVNDALGISVDGTVIPLQANIFHVSGTVAGFFQPASAHWAMFLPAGPHTVQLMLRGVGAGEFCSGSGTGASATLAANLQVPLLLTVQHQAVGVLPPAANVIVVDGIQKNDANFFSSTPNTPVPGTALTFTVSAQGNAYFAFSADFVGSLFGTSTFPNFRCGLVIDGTNFVLSSMVEQQGAGMDKVFNAHLAGGITLNLAPGSHTVQMIYDSTALFGMSLVANALTPATVSVIHP